MNLSNICITPWQSPFLRCYIAAILFVAGCSEGVKKNGSSSGSGGSSTSSGYSYKGFLAIVKEGALSFEPNVAPLQLSLAPKKQPPTGEMRFTLSGKNYNLLLLEEYAKDIQNWSPGKRLSDIAFYGEGGAATGVVRVPSDGVLRVSFSIDGYGSTAPIVYVLPAFEGKEVSVYSGSFTLKEGSGSQNVLAGGVYIVTFAAGGRYTSVEYFDEDKEIFRRSPDVRSPRAIEGTCVKSATQVTLKRTGDNAALAFKSTDNFATLTHKGQRTYQKGNQVLVGGATVQESGFVVITEISLKRL